MSAGKNVESMSHAYASVGYKKLKHLKNNLKNALDGEKSDEPFIVAYSGGRDSLTLVHLVALLPESMRSRARVRVVDHNHREGTLSDAGKALSLIEGLGLNMSILKVKERVRGGGTDACVRHSESSLRDLRHQVLIQAARCEGAKTIVLAHHQDDVAVGAMMHFLSGNPGLGISEEGILSEGVKLLRPFLKVSQGALREVLSGLGVHDYVRDPEDEACINDRARLEKSELLSNMDLSSSKWRERISEHAELFTYLRDTYPRVLQPETFEFDMNTLYPSHTSTIVQKLRIELYLWLRERASESRWRQSKWQLANAIASLRFKREKRRVFEVKHARIHVHCGRVRWENLH